MLVEDEDGALDSVMLSMEAGFEATVLHSTQSIHCTLLKICFMNCQIPHDVLPLVDLYLISEKSIWKNQIRRTGFFVYFELDFYCLCSLQKSILKWIFAGLKSGCQHKNFKKIFFAYLSIF